MRSSRSSPSTLPKPLRACRRPLCGRRAWAACAVGLCSVALRIRSAAVRGCCGRPKSWQAHL
ncbi:DUF2256 domain-containing protein [Corynebacterium tapiri]|uniref:DUF2256 domain-containing protein n=1 Tax=Corynebacterium tapiri TaxID=1448266 RepID=A0A5C4U559_9CORY|nr:DUF2256 domain-containing protein [Corynebacterium tapiri]